jgi:hypothetical protein
MAAHQQVLLCKKCNNTAGSRGDRQSQLYEQIWDGDRTGQIYGKRNLEILDKSDNLRSLLRNVKILRNQDGSIKISGPIDQRLEPLGNSPQDQSAFWELINRREPLSISVYPPHELKPELPPVGWTTSAYLMAFYCFGYRYILHSMLDPIRDYILNSFENNPTELRLPTPDVFAIGRYEDKCFPDPMIFLAIPLDGTTSIHLQIIFLEYMVKLPFHFDPNGLGLFLSIALPHVGINENISELIGRNEVILHTAKSRYFALSSKSSC